MALINTQKFVPIKLNIADIIYVSLILMIAFLVSASWVAQPQVESIPLIQNIGLSVLMTSLIGISLAFYVIGTLTGKFGALKVATPLMLIGAIVAIPLWLIYNLFLPSAIDLTGINNVLINFIGFNGFSFITQVWVFAVGESLFHCIMLYFFVVFSKTTKGHPALLPILFLINAFMALLHTGVALALQPAGFNFGVVLVHQFVAFFILSFFFFLGGTASSIGAHQVKNMIAQRLAFPFWIILFGVYLVFFILSGKKSKAQAITTFKNFGVPFGGN